MKETKLIKLFISCPSDIKEEINSIQLIITEINKTSGKQNDFTLEFVNWKYDTYTSIGEDPQAVINDQLDEEYDVLVGLLWQKIGTRTKRDKSGTIEEINRAINNLNKQLLVYFKTTPPENLNEIDIEQLIEINTFKKELTAKGLLYKEFNTIQEFESLFRINITNLILDNLILDKKNIQSLKKQKTTDKYADITSLIYEIETQDENEINIDVFQAVEEVQSYLSNVTISITSMTQSFTDLQPKLKVRTIELQKINNIKDNNLRMIKAKTIVNLLAGELNEFNSRISQEIPKFSDNFLKMGNSYSKLILAISNYETEEIKQMKTAAGEFKNTFEYATKQGANLLREISKWPPINFKFNKAKRETELVLKDLTKEMVKGLKFLDEIIE